MAGDARGINRLAHVKKYSRAITSTICANIARGIAVAPKIAGVDPRMGVRLIDGAPTRKSGST
jgi:hypothetical protein